MFHGTIEDKAKQAEELMASIAPGSSCIAQEWDDRIDCLIRLPNGSVTGEWIPLSELDEVRVRETAERLRKRAEGLPVTLVNEIKPPVRIRPFEP